MIYTPPEGPSVALNLLETLLSVLGEDDEVFNTRNPLPNNTEVTTSACFIVVFLTVRIENGLRARIFLPETVLTMALQLYAISKNCAKKNPAELIQRDVEKEKKY